MCKFRKHVQIENVVQIKKTRANTNNRSQLRVCSLFYLKRVLFLSGFTELKIQHLKVYGRNTISGWHGKSLTQLDPSLPSCVLVNKSP